MLNGKWLPVFQKSIIPPSSRFSSQVEVCNVMKKLIMPFSYVKYILHSVPKIILLVLLLTFPKYLKQCAYHLDLKGSHPVH